MRGAAAADKRPQLRVESPGKKLRSSFYRKSVASILFNVRQTGIQADKPRLDSFVICHPCSSTFSPRSSRWPTVGSGSIGCIINSAKVLGH